MISLGSLDARKQLGLGFGGGREMDAAELEERETCSYNNNDNDYDASMDPDVALSYIDEKLQDVLGHFQKDFEGGVSAENLGAKFGGYGSFLPAHQRSPVWSHPRTLPKIQHYNTPKSPNNLQLEGVRRSSVSSSTAPQSEVCMPSTRSAEELASRYEPANRKSDNLPDQTSLKVRIKVGSDNLSTRKNAAIYSGLGLDDSPSSSMDDSPSESEGMSHEPQDDLFDSPAEILRQMTCFPVNGALLLSPLPDDLIHLTEKDKLPKSRSLAVPRVGSQSSGIVLNGSDSLKGDGKILGEKKMKSVERNEISAESKSENNRGTQSDIDVTSKEESDLDILAGEELVSNSSKPIPLFNSYSATGDMAKGMGRASDMSKEAYKAVVRDKGSSDLTKDEAFTQDVAWVKNLKPTSYGKAWEDDGHHKEENLNDTVKIDSNVSKQRKALNAETKDPMKHNSNQKATGHEQEGGKVPPGKERSSSEGKKKLKGIEMNGNGFTEVPNESLRAGSSSMPKNKESTCVDVYTTKGELGDSKLQRNTAKARDQYREFFGKVELEQEENQMSLLEMIDEDRPKDSEFIEKGTHGMSNILKDRSNSKKTVKLSTYKAYPKAVSNVAPPGNGPISDAAHAAIAPVVADHWVCCDKCQTWRLLPPGKDPDDLPEKWLCTMLNWLPGMNRCSFSEEETTNALLARYQVFAPESQSNMQSNPDGVMSKVTLANSQHPDQNQLNTGSHAVPTGGKKKHGSKKICSTTCKIGSTLLSNSAKKSLQASVTNVSLNDVNHSSMESEPDFRKSSKSSDLALEKHKRKKGKQKVPDNCSDGGDTKPLKMKGKSNDDQDYSRASKKIRTECLPEEWMPDHGGVIERVGTSSSNGLPAVSSRKNLPIYNVHTSDKDSKYDQKDRMHVSAKSPKGKGQNSLADGSMDLQHDNRDASKKRKVKDSHDAQIYPGSLSNTGHNLPNSRASVKECSENDHRKEKKARVSRSEGKESSANNGNGKTDKKGSSRKNQQLGQDLRSNLSRRSLDGLDSLKRDSVSLHPSVTATSSSSKVSGSQKTKANFHDAKGSPVESVSSSPVRVSKPGKLASSRRKLTEKDDSIYAGPFALGGLRRRSDAEDDGGSVQSSDKVQLLIVPSPNISDRHFPDGGSDHLGEDTRYTSKSTASDQCHNNERQNENHYCLDRSVPKESGKGSSLLSKDKSRHLNSEFDNGKVNISDSTNEQAPSFEVKAMKGVEKFGVNSDVNEDRYVEKRESSGMLNGEGNKRDCQSNFGGHCEPDGKIDAICSDNLTSVSKQPVPLDCETVPGRGKSLPLPPSGVAQNEKLAPCPQPVSGSHKGEGTNGLAVNASASTGGSTSTKQIGKVDHPNGIHHNNSRNPMSNGHRVGDVDASSAVKKDSSSQAATNAMKEAKNLKHKADRLKNSGLTHESSWLYFEAALKFLHGASMLETCSSENARTGEMSQTKEMYSSTAKLCEFCAREYEKSKDLAAAALAYKCMEVAYMRVIYSSHTNANRDRHELQRALQVIPPGESPSSSASDIDNLNHPTAVDKVPSAKGISSPQVTGSHVIAPCNRPNFVRLLNFAQDVNFAMEASRKSRVAFAAASVGEGEAQNRKGISSVKAALDFNFQDVEGLLQLVRVAIQAINS